MSTSSDYPFSPFSIEEAMIRQTPTIDGWICPFCVNYKGALVCVKNVFIAFTQANMKGCKFYKQGRKCKHCGKATG